MSRRTERVAEAIRREAGLIISEQLRDPRIGFVTVTKATISDDLRNATIYYSVLGGKKQKDRARHGLKSAHNYIRGEISNRLGIRYAPEIFFKEDDTWEKTEEINRTFKRIENERQTEEDEFSENDELSEEDEISKEDELSDEDERSDANELSEDNQRYEDYERSDDDEQD
ncbi:MAG: 30S ribosome-binding factor RbfA [Candidatus Omnitrophica bacterium]|nr:30S ribosome-binding factor RbfA [Candidatus Omnitrophota bacterium]